MPEPTIVVAGLIVFGVGVLSGAVLRARSRSLRERERELESELSRERDAFATYREQVSKHMDQTAHLFRDLTNQHAALYQHLAKSARELSPSPGRAGGQAFGAALVDFASDPPDRLAGGMSDAPDVSSGEESSSRD